MSRRNARLFSSATFIAFALLGSFMVGCSQEPSRQTSTPTTSHPANSETQAQNVPVTSQPQTTETEDYHPKLWEDLGNADVISTLMAPSHVYVYRWKNRIVEGWIQFDTDEGPQRADFSEDIRSHVKELNRRFEEPASIPRVFSGRAIIIKKEDDWDEEKSSGPAWTDCRIQLTTRLTLNKEDKTTAYSELSTTYEGRVRGSVGSSFSGTSYSLLIDVVDFNKNMEKVPLMELRLTFPPD